MSKLFKGNGFLSEKGEKAFAPVVAALESLMASPEVRGMSENELRVLGANLASLAGNTISNFIQAKKNYSSNLDKMSDEQFYAFLKVKYGERWMLVSLTSEEFARCPPVSDEEMKEALAQGMKDREAAMAAMPLPNINPGQRYR